MGKNVLKKISPTKHFLMVPVQICEHFIIVIWQKYLLLVVSDFDFLEKSPISGFVHFCENALKTEIIENFGYARNGTFDSVNQI